MRNKEAMQAMQKGKKTKSVVTLEQYPDNPICGYCGKYKSLQGNGIIHQLCECANTHRVALGQNPTEPPGE
jgi:hypothetical protein